MSDYVIATIKPLLRTHTYQAEYRNDGSLYEIDILVHEIDSLLLVINKALVIDWLTYAKIFCVHLS